MIWGPPQPPRREDTLSDLDGKQGGVGAIARLPLPLQAAPSAHADADVKAAWARLQASGRCLCAKVAPGQGHRAVWAFAFYGVVGARTHAAQRAENDALLRDL